MSLKLPDYDNIELFCSVFNQFPGYLFLKDKSHKFILCNENYAEVLGFESSNDVQGLTDSDLPWSKKENDLYIKDDINVFDSKSPTLNIIETQTNGKEKRTLITSKYPILCSRGICKAVLGIFYYPSELQKELLLVSQIADCDDALLRLDKKNVYSVRLEDESLIEMSYYELITSVYLLRGLSAKMIANDISRSVRTVEHYIEQLKKKFKCSSKYALVDVLIRSNLIDSICR